MTDGPVIATSLEQRLITELSIRLNNNLLNGVLVERRYRIQVFSGDIGYLGVILRVANNQQ